MTRRIQNERSYRRRAMIRQTTRRRMQMKLAPTLAWVNVLGTSICQTIRRWVNWLSWATFSKSGSLARVASSPEEKMLRSGRGSNSNAWLYSDMVEDGKGVTGHPKRKRNTGTEGDGRAAQGGVRRGRGWQGEGTREGRVRRVGMPSYSAAPSPFTPSSITRLAASDLSSRASLSLSPHTDLRNKRRLRASTNATCVCASQNRRVARLAVWKPTTH